MAEIKFTLQSLSDLDDIAEYISKDSFYYASMQVQKLLKRAESLEKLPRRGRIVPELKIKSIRELIEGNYRIVYRIVNQNLIHILTFHHSKRKLRVSGIKRIIKRNK
jgi:toxin ParE1/3/4